eukprot:m.353667 g.353667  ORF g.353667 m.353667 type:complete len:96 (-) comp16817_c0_seq1:294-581(-)
MFKYMQTLRVAATRQAALGARQSVRNASGGSAHAYQDHLLPAEAGPWYRYAGTGMGAVMWFWILWRAKHDLPHMLGFEHPWDHMEDHADDGHAEA